MINCHGAHMIAGYCLGETQRGEIESQRYDYKTHFIHAVKHKSTFQNNKDQL